MVIAVVLLLVPRYVSQPISTSALQGIWTVRYPTGCDPGCDVSLGREIEPPLDALQVGADRLGREIEPMGNHCGLQPVSEEQRQLVLARCQSSD